jgi:EamA domain-containing membrane protein RarD
MKRKFLKTGLILCNLMYSFYVNYRVFKTFKIRESFPKAVETEKLWLFSLIALMIFNFIFEKKELLSNNYKLSILLVCLDLLVSLPLIFFTINELF